MPCLPIRLYGIKNCDTMKKAFAWLAAANIPHEFSDYKKAGVVAARLDTWLARSDWKTLLNTRGLMWKKLEASERVGVDAAKARELMLRYPVLIKRPVLETGDTLLVGFDPERYREVLCA
ncbi:MAG: arsenate reductase [Zoogloeaceae bacterium]|nr:arsenate reductase [Zoogloeaceae bacterium]